MKPLWAADELGLDYEQVDIGGEFGGNREADYLARNPMGLVPTLVENDLVLWESNAMTCYLVSARKPPLLHEICDEPPHSRRGLGHGTHRTGTTERRLASNRPAFPTSGH